MRRALLFAILLCGLPSQLFAQRYAGQEVPRYEVGVQFRLTHIERVSDTFVVGARFHYNFNEHLALDSQLTYGPATNRAGGSGDQTAFLVGVRAGQRVADSGFFLHARGGFVRYSPSNGGPPLFSRNTFPALDAGGTLEHYFGSTPWQQNMFFRLELGALIVPYRSATLVPGPATIIGAPPPPSGQLGTRVGGVLGLGFGFRF